MKKTYISPEILVVALSVEHTLLTDSLHISNTTVSGDDAGWTKEYASPSSSSTWDEEW